MPELTITLSNAAHQTLLELAETSGETMQAVLDKAIENYRRHVFLIQANRAFAALRQNQESWEDELTERAVWDQTIGDGLSESWHNWQEEKFG
ncbi:hypothetical protein [Thermoleptolyngbya sp. M55_K2018_002]|uniref:hypothetical protein n=1 Tax=Thermoleptolyngbya sp. M55_K2018_002 TaxID=2747808 RepID=UPI0019DD1913|nr:hypothetical protein [Thermoleptolyngbya sp. M55_K2018_002]HIK41457.1 toxin-antitoxin system protein [Thermoleptolyngbya sp. M55_K2018_002]